MQYLLLTASEYLFRAQYAPVYIKILTALPKMSSLNDINNNNLSQWYKYNIQYFTINVNQYFYNYQ